MVAGGFSTHRSHTMLDNFNGLHELLPLAYLRINNVLLSFLEVYGKKRAGAF
jgi:hypothetical protein